MRETHPARSVRPGSACSTSAAVRSVSRCKTAPSTILEQSDGQAGQARPSNGMESATRIGMNGSPGAAQFEEQMSPTEPGRTGRGFERHVSTASRPATDIGTEHQWKGRVEAKWTRDRGQRGDQQHHRQARVGEHQSYGGDHQITAGHPEIVVKIAFIPAGWVERSGGGNDRCAPASSGRGRCITARDARYATLLRTGRQHADEDHQVTNPSNPARKTPARHGISAPSMMASAGAV